jgi:hypothetical protein
MTESRRSSDGPGHYDRAVEDFVSLQNGGELTNQVLYGFLKAKNEDDKARYNDLKGDLQHHFCEAAIRDQRLLDHDNEFRAIRRRTAAAKTFGVGMLIAILLVAVASLEFIDQEKLAGIISIVLATATVAAGWYISAKRK